MSDRNLPAQPVQLLLVEDLRDEPEVAQRGEATLVRDRDARRLLPAMLEREEAEVRDARDVAIGGVDAEDAAHQRTTPISTSPREPSPATWLRDVARIAAPQVGSAGRSTSAWRPLQRAASASACSSPP